MDKQILNFTVNEQILVCENPIKISTNKVNYIQASFDLGTNWSGFDSVRAVWFNDFNCISTVLDSLGNCVVPFEVMKRKGNVKVNLVGSISEDDVLTDRLTSYPVVAVIVDCTAQITGANTSPITPSEYEQFVAAVHEDAERAEAGATASEQSATESANSASASAESAREAEAHASSAQIYAGMASNEAEASANSASEAQTYAQNASESATDAEGYAEDAESARDTILGMRATANTLSEGSDATASYSNGLLTLGIPRGNTGAKGDKGDRGDVGATPNLSIGTVTTLEPTEDATATISGTAENPILSFGIPKGDTGEVTQAELDEAVTDLKSDLTPMVFGGSRFTVSVGSVHSATKDQAKIKIKQGDSFRVIANKYGQIRAYFSDGTDTDIPIENNVASKDIVAIGIYYDNRNGESAEDIQLYVAAGEVGFELMEFDQERKQISGECANLTVGKATFYPYAHFVQGGLDNNQIYKPQWFRVSTVDHIVAEYDLLVSVKDTYRWGYIPYANGTYGSWSGWKTTDTIIPKGTEFIVQIARAPSDIVVRANVSEFVNAVTFKSLTATQIDELSKAELYVSRHNVETHWTWTYNAGAIVRIDVAAYQLSNINRIKVPKGAVIYCDTGYKYKYYLIGFDESIIYATNTWLTTKTTIEQDCYLLFAIVANNDSTPQTIDSLLPHFHIEEISTEAVSALQPQVDILNEFAGTDFQYKYDGGRLPVGQGAYDVLNTYVFAPSASSFSDPSITSFQGVAYYEGVIFQCYSDDKMSLVDYQTGATIASHDTETMHGNAMAFLGEFYDEQDEFPMAIVSDGISNKAVKIRVQRSGVTKLQDIVLPTQNSGYYPNIVVDAMNNVGYSIGYTENSTYQDPNKTNRMIICKWNLDNMANNGDGTVTPELLESFTIPFIITIQGPCFHNGMIYIISSHYSSTVTKLYVVDPSEKRIRNIITGFPSNIKSIETEGICFANIGGKDYGLIRTTTDSVYKLMRFNS